MSDDVPNDQPASDGPSAPERPSVGTILGRALRLRCPRCGVGPLFVRRLAMHESCDRCRLKYEPSPGFYLGSSYLNYGATTLTLLVAYPVLHFGCGFSNTQLTLPLVAWVMLFPLLFFRYARALWLGMDLYFDPTTHDEHT